MDNKLKHALGDRPNSEFIIDPAGKIVRMRDWSSADAVRSDLDELVGRVDNPTDPRSLNLRTDFAPTKVARGVVERVSRPVQMSPVKVETKEATHPAYVKLRAEVDADLQRDGRGKLYLGFFVDPIHRVHWNNQSGPVIVELNGRTHTGPVVEPKADADPREFVLDVEMDQPVKVTLKYIACDDEETWCKRLTQTFIVSPERDRDAGRVTSRGGRGGRPNRRPGGR